MKGFRAIHIVIMPLLITHLESLHKSSIRSCNALICMKHKLSIVKECWYLTTPVVLAVLLNVTYLIRWSETLLVFNNYRIVTSYGPGYHIVEKVGRRKHWRIQLFRLFGGENLGKCLPIKYRYWIFCKFEGENFGDWPSICQIRQCFLPPTFSTIRYSVSCSNFLPRYWPNGFAPFLIDNSKGDVFRY